MITISKKLSEYGVKLGNSKNGNGLNASLYHGTFSSEVLPILSEVENLKELVFYVSNISDDDLKGFYILQNVEVLGLLSCYKITDKGIVNLSKMQNLNSLSVLDTKVSVEGAMALSRALPNLKILGVCSNSTRHTTVNILNEQIIE